MPRHTLTIMPNGAYLSVRVAALITECSRDRLSQSKLLSLR